MQMTGVRCRWLQELGLIFVFFRTARFEGLALPFSFWEQVAAGEIVEQTVGATGASGPGNNSRD